MSTLSFRGTTRTAGAALLVMAMLWGSTFFIIKDTLERIPAADLLLVRFAASALILAIAFPKALAMDTKTLSQGVLAGLFFGSAQLTQTIGLAYTAASVNGFITGLYVVFTPFFDAVLFRRRIARSVWVAVVLATLGMAFLTVAPGALSGRFGIGEALTLLSAILYAGHIIVLGRVATPANSMSLTIVQAVVLALICLPPALPGGVVLPTTSKDWLVLVYLAVICGSLTLWLQIWAQARIEATRASVIMCTEPVWAAVFAVLFGSEMLTFNTVLGGAIMVSGIYLAIMPPRVPTNGQLQQVLSPQPD